LCKAVLDSLDNRILIYPVKMGVEAPERGERLVTRNDLVMMRVDNDLHKPISENKHQ
jgi:hypothetical protein